ncbi:MAG: hypothetical protein NVS9B9_15000 [Ktedonobacteraceae bacterium]
MSEITINTTDLPLTILLQAERDFPGYTLDVCSGYVSTNGILPIKTLLKSSSKVRAVVGLNPTNHLSAFQMLYHDCGVELYVYVTKIGRLFHPKVYFGTLNAQAWAMVGSSNLTYNGLSGNIEQNLFVTGQRHIEPFVSIEAQIAAFQQQAYLFDADVEKQLHEIERKLGQYPQETEYKKRLFASGIRPKTAVERVIPIEAQQMALDTLFNFAQNTYLEYAYQMLLLLVLIDKADEQGLISVDEAASYCIEFYKRRREAGLPGEKIYGSKRAVMGDPNVNLAKTRQMLKTSPFPRFERQGLLDLSEDGRYFIVNPALVEAFTSETKERLRELAMERLKEHFK